MLKLNCVNRPYLPERECNSKATGTLSRLVEASSQCPMLTAFVSIFGFGSCTSLMPHALSGHPMGNAPAFSELKLELRPPDL